MTRDLREMSIPIPPVTISIKIKKPPGYEFRMGLMRIALSVAAALAPGNVTVEADVSIIDAKGGTE